MTYTGMYWNSRCDKCNAPMWYGHAVKILNYDGAGESASTRIMCRPCLEDEKRLIRERHKAGRLRR